MWHHIGAWRQMYRKIKFVMAFLILHSFLKMKHSSSYFQLKLSSQIYISGNWSTFWNRILSENCAFLWNRKMAEPTPENTLFFCSANHVGSETVLMDRYKIMCRMHVPVYLFPDASGRDVPRVSLSCRYLQINFCKWWYSLGRNQLGKYSCYIFLILEKKDVDETDHTFAVYICTRCGENFHRGSLDAIRDHLVLCSIRVPTFLRTCHFCGLVSLFKFS